MSPHDPKIVATAPDSAPPFNAGRKEEEPRRYGYEALFALNRKARLFPTDVCLGAVDENWISCAPLAARDAGKAGDGVVQWLWTNHDPSPGDSVTEEPEDMDIEGNL